MTLEKIEEALRRKGYPEYLIRDQADWIFEEYWNEEHLRDQVFFQIVYLTSLLE